VTQNKDFVKKQIDDKGPHALLGRLVQEMSAVEAHLICETAAQHYPSTVAQSVLRDALNRVRAQDNLLKAAP
jgi:hypothetical protein